MSSLNKKVRRFSKKLSERFKERRSDSKDGSVSMGSILEDQRDRGRRVSITLEDGRGFLDITSPEAKEQRLKDDEEQAAKENVPDIVKRAVSLEFLLRFGEYLNNKYGPKIYRELETNEAVHGRGVKPRKKKDGSLTYDGAGEFSVRGLTQSTMTNFRDFMESEASEQFRKELLGYSNPRLDKVMTQQQKGNNSDSKNNSSSSEEAPKHMPWFGRADFFVSHPWSLKFVDLIEALEDPRCSGSKDFSEHVKKYFWLDIFAVNQSYLEEDRAVHEKAAKEREDDLNGFEDVIKNSKKGMVLFFHPWNEPRLLERAWCWHEIHKALTFNKDIKLALTKTGESSLKHVSQCYCKMTEDANSSEDEIAVKQCQSLFKNIDVKKSRCLLKEDEKRILREIETTGYEVVNEKIKLAIAGILMTTADSLSRSQNVDGTRKLYEEMLSHFSHSKAPKAVSLNQLCRVYSVMGRNDKAFALCNEAIQIQRDLLKEKRKLSTREYKEISKNLAASLSSLGRLWGETRKPENLQPAVDALEESLTLQRNYGDKTGEHEVLYNLGRAYVFHYETQKVRSDQDRQRLEQARDYLEKSKRIQEGFVDRPASLGACCVFLGKIIDLLDGDEKEAAAYFERGYEIQQEKLGKSDARCFFTLIDYARHLIHRKHYDQAWTKLLYAQNGLTIGVLERGEDPVKLLECFVEMKTVLECVHYDDEDTLETVIRGSIKFIDWFEDNKPHRLDQQPAWNLIKELQKMRIEYHGSKRNWVLSSIEEYIKSNNMDMKTLDHAVDFTIDMEAMVEKKSAPSTPKTNPDTVPIILEMKMEDMLSAIPSNTVDVIICDAPYNRGVDGAWDAMAHSEFVETIGNWSRLMVRCLSPEGLGFAFTDPQYCSFWMTELRKARGSPAIHENSGTPAPPLVVEAVVWYKPNASWRKDWVEYEVMDASDITPEFRDAPQIVRDCTEMIVIFRKSKDTGRDFQGIVSKYLAERAGNVWEKDKCVAPERLMEACWHPCQKPLSIIHPLVKFAKKPHVDNERDLLVLEPFMGTGTALVSSYGMGIPSLGCDMDGKWIEIVQKRCKDVATGTVNLNHFTGEQKFDDGNKKSRRSTRKKSSSSRSVEETGRQESSGSIWSFFGAFSK